MNKTKSRLSKKIFFFIISILLLSFFLVMILSRVFLEGYTAKYRKDYLENLYLNLVKTNYTDDEFEKEVDSLTYETIYFMCYDSESNEITYSNVGPTYEVPNESFKNILPEFEKSDYLSILPKSIYEEDIFNITKRSQQITVIGKYLSKDSSLYLILQTPYKPVIDIASSTSRFYIIALIISILISIAPTTALMYSITKPLKEATLVAKKIQNKDFSERCIIRTNDEVAELGKAINTMADSIDIYAKELESNNLALKNDIQTMKKVEKTQKEFVSNVSHEIKTPISIISGYAEAIKQNLPSSEEEKNEYCDIIIDECDRMTNIVVELINLSKLESGMIELDYSDFSAVDLCSIIASKFKLKCSQENINLAVEPETKSKYMVHADYNEIEKVLINYLQNAYKHVSDKGTIKFIIRQEGTYVYIGVNNDGNQISEEERLHIWDKFYKVDKSHKREENSTGLGLSIVKASMDLHKMPYGVKNTSNGVEFYIKIRAV